MCGLTNLYWFMCSLVLLFLLAIFSTLRGVMLSLFAVQEASTKAIPWSMMRRDFAGGAAGFCNLMSDVFGASGMDILLFEIRFELRRVM